MPDKKQHRAVIEVDEQLLNDIADLIENRSDTLLKNIIADVYPADIAEILNNLEDDQSLYLFKLLEEDTASETLLELNDSKRDLILEALSAGEITNLLGEMESDDATDIVSELEEDIARDVLTRMDKGDSREVQELLEYSKDSAGGIMQKEYIVVNQKLTINDAVKQIRTQAAEMEHVYDAWVINEENHRLLGKIPFMTLLVAMETPGAIIADIMDTEVISVDIETDRKEVARTFQKYNLVSLPVVNKLKQLVGRISIDDVMDILEEEFSEDVAKIVGSDAEELESKSPVQIALMRLPWVLITLAIEMLSGLVISMYNATLSKVILLASFMPIISAISGNTGLQAAAITVRALATGHASLSRWKEPMKRSLQTSVIIGAACGLLVAIVGGFWYGRTLFGIVVGTSMFISINISGFVGTSVPMLSKRMGFDPAITAGPFETAFQDVVGILIFLTIATLSLNWLL